MPFDPCQNTEIYDFIITNSQKQFGKKRLPKWKKWTKSSSKKKKLETIEEIKNLFNDLVFPDPRNQFRRKYLVLSSSTSRLLEFVLILDQIMTEVFR